MKFMIDWFTRHVLNTQILINKFDANPMQTLL